MLCTVARLAVVTLCLEGIFAQNGPTAWSASPFTPPAWPLAVRSPYLNSWSLQGNNPAPLNTEWAVQWSGSITGWYASAVVDGQAYKLLGDAAIPTVNANQTAVEFTATRTSFIFIAGPMQINASFLSPVEPTDLVRQSMPYSYLSISASSTDGNSHSLRLYSDVSGEFIAGNVSDIAQWASSDEGEYVVLSMQLQSQQKYVEVFNHPQDATEYYALKKISGTTTSWAITTDVINRGTAANGTSLGNKVDTNFRGVGDNWPVLGIAVDWQSVQSTSQPAVWAIAVVRGPSIQYRTSSGSLQDRYPYFLSAYGDGATAAKGFLDDFSRAQSAAATFDAQLHNAGKQISSNYADLLALVTRQALGSLDITLAKSGDGTWNSSDVKVFMKNMGGTGSDVNATSLSVNTVDTLYAAFPLFLYLNPELGGYLLSPLLEYQDSAVYILDYAAKNIGSSYPNATADDLTSTHDFGIEETANMLIMTLAYSQRSGNGTFIGKHYALLKKWAEYLGNNTLTPSNQRSADSFVLTNNETNLALKGIIGIASMAKISELAGNSDDQKTFNDTAFSYISQWQNDAVASDNSHIDFFYGKADSNGLIYNLYADKLLQLNLVSSFVYDAATVFYNNAGGKSTYGLPLDSSDPDRSTTQAMIFSASTVTNPSIQDAMVSQLHNYAADNINGTVFSTTYDPSSGEVFGPDHSGKNSPASGAIYSFLALNTTIKSVSIPPNQGGGSSGGSSGGSGSGSSSGNGSNSNSGGPGGSDSSSIGKADFRTLAGKTLAGIIAVSALLSVF